MKRDILLQKIIIFEISHGGERQYFVLLGCDSKRYSRQTQHFKDYDACTSVLFYPENGGRGSSEAFVLVLMT